MPSAACRLQYAGFLLPAKLKPGPFVQKSCEQRFFGTSTMPCSACRLQYAAEVFPPETKAQYLRAGLVPLPFSECVFAARLKLASLDFKRCMDFALLLA